MTTDVRHNPAEHRYEVWADGALAGFAAYREGADRLTMTHTEIDPTYEGQGLGSRLAQGALDDVRAQDKRVVPVCPFIAGWIERHPDYAGVAVQPVPRE